MLYKKADNSSLQSACCRLYVLASDSFITDKFSCLTLISVSVLHLGQKRGKYAKQRMSPMPSLLFHQLSVALGQLKTTDKIGLIFESI